MEQPPFKERIVKACMCRALGRLALRRLGSLARDLRFFEAFKQRVSLHRLVQEAEGSLLLSFRTYPASGNAVMKMIGTPQPMLRRCA
jgi:hypothetical protein